MVSRRFLVVISLLTTAAAFFLLGVFHARTDDAAVRAAYDAKLDALRAEVRSQLGKATAAERRARGDDAATPRTGRAATARPASRARMIAEIKRELQSEMGLLPLAAAARPALELRRAVCRPTTSARPATAPPAISATATSSPSSTPSSR